MKIKSGTIYNAIETINEIAEKPMRVGLAAKFLRLADDLQRENKYTDKQRREILMKYGIKDENGEVIIEDGNIKFAPEDIDTVQKELQELSDVEVEIQDRNITEEELENSNIELTIKQLVALREFFHKEELEVIE